MKEVKTANDVIKILENYYDCVNNDPNAVELINGIEAAISHVKDCVDTYEKERSVKEDLKSFLDRYCQHNGHFLTDENDGYHIDDIVETYELLKYFAYMRKVDINASTIASDIINEMLFCGMNNPNHIDWDLFRNLIICILLDLGQDYIQDMLTKLKELL